MKVRWTGKKPTLHRQKSLQPMAHNLSLGQAEHTAIPSTPMHEEKFFFFFFQKKNDKNTRCFEAMVVGANDRGQNINRKPRLCISANWPLRPYKAQ